MKSERYQVMFVFRPSSLLDFLNVVGVDYNSCSLWSVLIHSLCDSIDLKYNTDHYPSDLIKVLCKEKKLIDSGYYDIRTWQITTWEKAIKERKEYDSMIKDRDLTKWQPMLAIPEQRKMLAEVPIEQDRISKPQLSEFELEDINLSLIESLELQIPVNFRLYESGFIKNTSGVVHKIDPHQKIVRISDTQGFRKIEFTKIIGVEAM
jgi:hypothetical protein